jgi:hypothetical protein
MISPQNIASTVRMFMPLGSIQFTERFSETADLAADGPEFIAVS